MPDDREHRPDDPEAWIALAIQDLLLARSRPPGVGFGLLTYHAQQAAEKAVKATLLAHAVPFPYVHDIGALITLLRRHEVDIPDPIAEADLLSDYATLGRYPGPAELNENDYRRAITPAEAVVDWAKQHIDQL